MTTLRRVDIPVNTGLPRRGTDKTQSTRSRVIEDVLDLLQSLGGSLGEHEEDVYEHDRAEDAKQDVHLPGNVSECRRHEVGERKVERPVGAGGEGDGLSTDTERVQLRWVDPGDWSPSRGVGGDEEVGARNESGGGLARNAEALSGVIELVGAGWAGVGRHETGVGVHPGCHQCGTNKQCWAATPSVDPDQGRDSHDDVDNILNARGEQHSRSDVGHCEDILEDVSFISIIMAWACLQKYSTS